MKNTFEKIDSTKFKAIEVENMMHILGGEKTGGGNFPGTMTPKYDTDGKMYWETTTTFWKTDEIDGKDRCFYGEYDVVTRDYP